VTVQLAELPLPERVQMPPPPKVPLLSLVKLTVPVGVLAVPPLVSLTVAVQVVDPPTGTLAGVQLTLVLVARFVTVTVVVPELVACVVSPL